LFQSNQAAEDRKK